MKTLKQAFTLTVIETPADANNVDDSDVAEGKRVVFIEARAGKSEVRYRSPVVDDDDVAVANALATCLVELAGSIVSGFRAEQKEPSRIIAG